MNKETFLMILREKLSILDEKEIEDIIQEYSNHIDEKISHGDTEVDAVKAFGNIDSLAAEILKGYKISDDYRRNDWFNNLSKILSDMANSIVDFFERLTKGKSLDVSNALASILVAIILLFAVNVVVNILHHVGSAVIGIGDTWYSNDPLLIIWLIIVNLVRVLAIVMIIYTTYRNIANNKAPVFFGGKNTNDTSKKKTKNSNVAEKKVTVETKKVNKMSESTVVNSPIPTSSGLDKTIVLIVKVFVILFSIPFYFVIFGLLFAIAVIIGLMIKGVFFWGVLLILIGLVIVISSIIGMIFKLIGGIK